MHVKNSSTHYGSVSIAIHWLTAIVVYAMFGVGLWMVTLGYYDTWYHKAPELHKSVGMVLLAVMLFRVAWRFISPPPKPLSEYSLLTRYSAVIAHLMLYGLLFAILFSGYLIATAEGKPVEVFGLVPVPATLAIGKKADLAGDIHLWLAWFVVLLSVLHGLAAIKHHFIDKDITLKRMLGRRIN